MCNPVRNPNAELLNPPFPGLVVIALRDHHVPAVAVAPLEVATPRGVWLGGRHDFQELVADRQQSILEPVCSDCGVDMADLEPEDGLELLRDGSDVVREETNLSETQPHERVPP